MEIVMSEAPKIEGNITNEDYEKIVHAIAESRVISILGKPFDGGQRFNYEDIQGYYLNVINSDEKSRAINTAVLTAVMQDNYNDANALKNISTAALKDKARLKSLLGNFVSGLEQCYRSGNMEDISTNNGQDVDARCVSPIEKYPRPANSHFI
jgi:hypothetical protein